MANLGATFATPSPLDLSLGLVILMHFVAYDRLHIFLMHSYIYPFNTLM